MYSKINSSYKHHHNCDYEFGHFCMVYRKEVLLHGVIGAHDHLPGRPSPPPPPVSAGGRRPVQWKAQGGAAAQTRRAGWGRLDRPQTSGGCAAAMLTHTTKRCTSILHHTLHSGLYRGFLQWTLQIESSKCPLRNIHISQNDVIRLHLKICLCLLHFKHMKWMAMPR